MKLERYFGVAGFGQAEVFIYYPVESDEIPEIEIKSIISSNVKLCEDTFLIEKEDDGFFLSLRGVDTNRYNFVRGTYIGNYE